MRHISAIFAIFVGLVALPPPALSQDALSLMFPVDCTLGETCFLQQFVDRDSSPDARAFDCGPQSYDGHTGTDIRVADFSVMAAGVTVRAAAEGTVRALRDGVPDGGTAVAPEGQGCGNGVVLTHMGGWESQYCHLMEGSVVVAQGDRVTAGAPLGQIGYSGQTEFPHLEFVLRHNGAIVDPFDPSDLAQCGAETAPLWAENIHNTGGGILSVGFAETIPEFADIQNGTAHAGRISATGEALVLWVFVHGGRAGDVITLRILDSDGTEVHVRDVSLDQTQAQLFRASGRRTPAEGWAPGLYRGDIALHRDGSVIDQAETDAILTND